VAKSRLSPAFAAAISGGFTRNYAWRASILGKQINDQDFAGCPMADGVAPFIETARRIFWRKIFRGLQCAPHSRLASYDFAGFAVQKTNCCGRVINSGGALAPGSNPVQFAFQP
jgi:hypothetical protein